MAKENIEQTQDKTGGSLSLYKVMGRHLAQTLGAYGYNVEENAQVALGANLVQMVDSARSTRKAQYQVGR